MGTLSKHGLIQLGSHEIPVCRESWIDIEMCMCFFDGGLCKLPSKAARKETSKIFRGRLILILDTYPNPPATGKKDATLSVAPIRAQGAKRFLVGPCLTAVAGPKKRTGALQRDTAAQNLAFPKIVFSTSLFGGDVKETKRTPRLVKVPCWRQTRASLIGGKPL